MARCLKFSGLRHANQNCPVKSGVSTNSFKISRSCQREEAITNHYTQELCCCATRSRYIFLVNRVDLLKPLTEAKFVEYRPAIL